MGLPTYASVPFLPIAVHHEDNSLVVSYYMDVQFSSVAQSCPTLRPHESQHARPPCPSPTPRACSNSRPLPSNHLILCHPLLLQTPWTVWKGRTTATVKRSAGREGLKRQSREYFLGQWNYSVWCYILYDTIVMGTCQYGCVLSCFSRLWLFVTLWAIVSQAPLEFSRQESSSELPCPPLQGIFLAQGSMSHPWCLLHCQVGSLPLAPPGKPTRQYTFVQTHRI